MKSSLAVLVFLQCGAVYGQFLRHEFDAPENDSNLGIGDQAAARLAIDYWNSWLDTAGHDGFGRINFFARDIPPVETEHGRQSPLAEAPVRFEPGGEARLSLFQAEWQDSAFLLHPNAEIYVHSGYTRNNGLLHSDGFDYDLTSTLIHEIGHHLGVAVNLRDSQFVSLMTADDGRGPDTWDLQSASEVFFNGPEAVNANDGSPVSVYWNSALPNSGSNLSHPTAPAGTLYAMLAGQSSGVELRGLHAVEVGLFKDLGWAFRDPAKATARTAVTYTVSGTKFNPSWHFGGFWTDEFDNGLGGLPPTSNTDVKIAEGALMEVRELNAFAKSLKLEGGAGAGSAKLTILNGKTLAVNSAVDIRSNSVLNVEAGGLVIVDHAPSNPGISVHTGGTLNVGTESMIGSPLFQMAGGEWQHDGVAELGILKWSAGQITGDGAIRVGNFRIASGQSVTLGAAAPELQAGRSILEEGSTLAIGQGGRLQSDGGFQLEKLSKLAIGESVPFGQHGQLIVGDSAKITLSGQRSFSNDGRMDMLNNSSMQMTGNFANNGGLHMAIGAEIAIGAGDFENNGLIVMDGSRLHLSGNSFTNEGGMTLIGDATIASPGAMMLLSNWGGITKQGIGTAVIEGEMRNFGGINVAAGILRITDGGGNFGGGISVAPGAKLAVSASFSLDEGISGLVLIDERKVVSESLSVVGIDLEVPHGVEVAEGGSLKGTGHIITSQLAISGTLAPGASPGQLTVTGDVTFSPTAILEFELGPPASSDYDHLVVKGTNDLTLDGTLVIVPYDGFGEGSYELIRYEGALVNNILDVAPIAGGFIGMLVYEPGRVNLHVAIPEPSYLAVLGLVLVICRRWRRATH